MEKVASDERLKKYQSTSPNKDTETENFEEEYEEDYENAYENYESIQISSSSMNYSESKTGAFDEHVDLPPSRYAPIEENPEENEDSKFQQPTQEELDLQNIRIKKAKEALIKMKKEELSKKKTKNQKLITPKINNEKSISSSKNLSQKKENIGKQDAKKKIDTGKKEEKKEKVKKENKQALNFKEEKKAEGNFQMFQIEKPVKGTNEAPPVKPPGPSSIVPPLKLNKPSSVDNTKAVKKEEEARIMEEHKKNLENLRLITDEKKAKDEKNLKNMEEIQKKLLEREKNYKISVKEPPKPKKTPPAAPAPKPRALTTNSYKLHQLAENIGNSESRLTADKLSGSMFQAIKILSTKVSEEFSYQEILEENKRIEQAEKMLSTGKDMKREGVDYHEETKKRLIVYKEMIAENIRLMNKKLEVLKQQDDLTDQIKKLEPLKAVVKMGEGKYVRAGLMPEGLVDTLEELNSVGSEVMKENPIDVIIEKIESQGTSLRQLFTMIDFDGDKILSITEIRNGLAGIQFKLTDDDKELLLKTLDLNSDGYVSEEEFFKILDPKLRAQQDYRAIVGSTNINNPIIFEEKILDMKFKGRMLNKEIPALVKKLESKIECEKKLVQRIKQLEKILEDRQVRSVNTKDITQSLSEQLQNVQAKKAEIFQMGLKEKSTNTANLAKLQEKLMVSSKEKALVNSELEEKKNALTGLKIRHDAITSKESKLDQANRIIAIVIIQSRVKRFLARIRYKKEKEAVENALKVITPVLRKNVNNKKKQRELARNKEILPHENIIEKVQQEKIEIQDSCVKCKKVSDRICLDCSFKTCPECFENCREKLHNFGLFESDTKELSHAENEFLNILKNLQEKNKFRFRDLLKSGLSSKSAGISYIALRKILLEKKPQFEKFIITNLLVFSQKFKIDENFIDVNQFSETVSI